MAKIYGKAFSADRAKYASGTSHDAAVRRHRNTVSLATEGGGTQNTLIIGKVREGNCVEAVSLASDVNLSGINFTVGVEGNPTKYAIAQAGPAAGATVRFQIVPAQLGADALATPDEVLLFPSANLPAAGLMVASVLASHR